MYSLSVIRHLTQLRMVLNAGSASSLSAGLDFNIFFNATCSSDDSFKSGATEKNRENSGSVSIKMIKMTALLNVLWFFLLISSSAVV